MSARSPATVRRAGVERLSISTGTVALVSIFLVALAVRLYHLTYHSLWFDEVMSTYWAARPAREIWQVGMALVQDKHPPAYYLLLHAWTVLFGPGDYAVRSFGAIVGALAVFPVVGIGHILGGRRAGLIGGLLVALNPFLVWYSQEARMFMPATTFVLVGLYGLLQLMYAGKLASENSGVPSLAAAGGFFVLTVLGFTAALYSYLFSALVLPVAASWVFVIWWAARNPVRPSVPDASPVPAGDPQRAGAEIRGSAIRSRPRTGQLLAWGLAAISLVLLLFLPLVRSAWSVSGAESVPGQAFEALFPTLARLLRLFTIGWPAWPTPWQAVLTMAAGLLALAGVLVPDRPGSRRRQGGLLLALWLLLPVLAGGLLQTRDRTVFAEPRYFIFLVPPLCLAWARACVAVEAIFVIGQHGLSPLSREDAKVTERASGDLDGHGSRLRSRAGAALLLYVPVAILVLLCLLALPWLWRPENRREAWRETAEYITTHAGPNDAILVEPDYVAVALRRYLGDKQPVFTPFSGPLTNPNAVDGPLSGLGGFDTVWLVQSHYQEFDPGNLVAGWFGARFPLGTELFPPGIALRAFVQRYRTPGLPSTSGATLVPADATIGGLQLLACNYSPQVLTARESLFHPPSGWVHVTTYWTAATPVAAKIVPAATVVDDQGQVWGNQLARPNDAFQLWPTGRWVAGEVVRQDADVNLNPVTPSGAYRLVLQLPGQPGEIPCGTVNIGPEG